MLYYKKRLSGGGSIDIRLNGHEPDDGFDRGMPSKICITLVGILRNKELFAEGRSERDLN